MTTNAPEPIGSPPPNPRHSEAVLTIAKRIMHTEGIQIGWMTQDVAAQLRAMFVGGETIIKMQILRHGMTAEQAEKHAEAALPLVAFELGLKIGAELESTRAFREIMGSDIDFNFDEEPGGEGG